MTTETVTALVPVADGTEELEAVTIIDVLRRAGVEVTVASVAGRRQVTCSRGVVLVADRLLSASDHRAWHAVVLPGGMPGAEALRDSAVLTRLLRDQLESGRLVAAICAAPAVVLGHHGLLAGRRATCHPGFYDELDDSLRAEEPVVRDGNLLTSRGPGTALPFALALVEALLGAKARAAVAGPMVTRC